MQTHLCVWLGLWKMQVNRSTPLCSAPPIALCSSLSLLRVHSSTCFAPQHSRALPAIARALARALRHSLQLFLSQLSRYRLFLSIIGSFFLVLPLHHSLTGLSQFQHPAHSAALSSQSACPHHESFMNQCLFSALIGECSFQTSQSPWGRTETGLSKGSSRTSWLDMKSLLLDCSQIIHIIFYDHLLCNSWCSSIFLLLSLNPYKRPRIILK